MKKNKVFDNKMTVLHGLLAIVFGLIVVSYPKLSVSLLAVFLLFSVGIWAVITGGILICAYVREYNIKRLLFL